MHDYDIAGLSIAIDLKKKMSYIEKRMYPFLKKSDDHKDIIIDTIEMNEIENPLGEMIINEEMSINWVSKENKKSGFYGYMTRIASKEIMAMLETDTKWENTSVSYANALEFIDQQVNPVEMMTFHLMGAIFRNRILFHDGIVLHASSIKWRDKGIVFSAPSGTGKSTHVRLWEKYNGTEVSVLNDDTPAIRMINGMPFVFGTPWSGSSDKFTNTCAPLSAIVILEQAPENSICKLSTFDALTKIMPRCFLPYFDQELMDRAVGNMEDIIRKTPFYILKCRPDKEAMELVSECV